MPVSIEHLSCSYDNTPVLQDISLHISEGEFIALLGKNGSGKSTLALSIMGIIPHALPAKMIGNIYINGENIKKKQIAEIARSIGIVFQNPDMVIFNPTVREEVSFGIQNLQLDNPDERIHQALKDVGLDGYEERDPQTLSEGQKQKLCIACVLAMGTDFIILDEPISHLDYTNAVIIYELLHTLYQKGKTIMVIEHDTDFVFKYTDRTCVVHQGKIVLDGPSKKILKDTKKMEAYGVKPIIF